MTEKEFYRKTTSYEKIHRELEYALKRLETLKESRGIKASVQQEVRGGGGNQAEDVTVDIVDLENKIKELKKEYSIKQAELYKIFNHVKEPTLKYLLIYRYIDLMDWDSVADTLHFSRVHTSGVLKRKAIKELLKLNTR